MVLIVPSQERLSDANLGCRRRRPDLLSKLLLGAAARPQKPHYVRRGCGRGLPRPMLLVVCFCALLEAPVALAFCPSFPRRDCRKNQGPKKPPFAENRTAAARPPRAACLAGAGARLVINAELPSGPWGLFEKVGRGVIVFHLFSACMCRAF